MYSEDSTLIGYAGNRTGFIDEGCSMARDIKARDRQQGEFKGRNLDGINSKTSDTYRSSLC